MTNLCQQRLRNICRQLSGGVCLFVFVTALLVATQPNASAQNLENGKKVYLNKCSQCHGLEGTPYVQDKSQTPPQAKRDSDGRAILDEQAAPAASHLMPRPRDFTQGMFKIRISPSGEVPSDEDLARIISRGMPGSSMPAWEGEISQSDIQDVAAYVKTFSPRFASEKPSKAIDVSGSVSYSDSSVEKGKALFTENGCNSCHGEKGRGDGQAAATLKDDWGNPLYPANFHKGWTLRGGGSREDIFRTVMTGLNGTPMPSYADVFGDTKEGREKAWNLVNYIYSLSKGRPNIQQVLRAEFRPELPAGPEDPVWEKRPPADFLLVGQVIAEPRQFTPSIDRVAAKAFYNKEEVALLLEWDDRFKDATDAIEVEVPLHFSPKPGQTTESEKPYFLRGDSKSPVELWHWDAKSDCVRAFSSKGPKSKPEPLAGEGVYVSSSSYADGLWKLYVRRKLSPESGVSIQPRWFLPMAFFAWDGANGDSGLKCSVSTWYYLLLEPPVSALAYAMPVLALFVGFGVQGWLLKKFRGKG